MTKVYIKPGCPWCDEATAFLDEKGIDYETIVVSGNKEAMQEMVNLSGQTKAPTMEMDGAVLADFGVDELKPFLAKRGLI